MNIFVLSGGNTKGGFQYGVMDELDKLGIKPDIIVGNSIGAVNGFIYTHTGLGGMHSLWNSVSKRSDYLRYNWRSFFWDGIYDLEPLREILEEISFSGHRQIKCYSTTVNLETGRTHHVSSDDDFYLDATLGSSAEPVFMKPIQGKWVDGGLREIVPLEFALSLDSNAQMYVINTMPYTRNPYPEKIKLNLLSLLTRTLDIMTHENGFRDVQQFISKRKINLFAPIKPLHDSLVFDNKVIKNDIEIGRLIVKEYFNEPT